MLKDLRSGAINSAELQDPYHLVPGVACPVDADVSGWGLYPRYDSSVGVLGVPHFMASVNSRVVRRSMALLGRHGVSYREGMSFGSLWSSFAFAVPYIARGELPLLPRAGEGPPPSMQLAGGYTAKIVAQDAGARSGVAIDVEGRGDPGYRHTSKLLAEVGFCLLDSSCHRGGVGGGILTIASATDTAALVKLLHEAKHEDGFPLLTYTVGPLVNADGNEEL